MAAHTFYQLVFKPMAEAEEGAKDDSESHHANMTNRDFKHSVYIWRGIFFFFSLLHDLMYRKRKQIVHPFCHRDPFFAVGEEMKFASSLCKQMKDMRVNS